MILDRTENARLYIGLHHRFAKAFEILTDKTLSQKDDGKYPVDGDNIYYAIQKYTTKPMSGSPPVCNGDHCQLIGPANLEAHRKYIDIQFLLSGVELLGYTPLKDLPVAEEYNTAKDIAFFHTPKDITKIKLEPGLFCILFPDDTHLPGCHLAGPSEVRKVVVKIRL